MRDSSPYTKSFVGSLLIHLVLLSFLILSFNQHVHLSTPNTADTIIQAVMMDAQPFDRQEAERLQQQKEQQALEIEQQQQLAQAAQKKQEAQKKIEEQAKATQLQRDMLAAKKQAALEKTPEKTADKVERLLPPKQDPAAIAVQEERIAENERLKQVRLTQEKEQKKRAQLKAQKAAEALKTKMAAEKARVAAEKNRVAAEKARLAAHQKQIDTEVATVVSAWSTKIENNRRSMSAFQSLAQDLSCRISLHILPDGSVRAQLVQSSGNALYDDLALKAIYKAEPFVLPDNPEVRDKVKAIELNFLNDI